MDKTDCSGAGYDLPKREGDRRRHLAVHELRPVPGLSMKRDIGTVKELHKVGSMRWK